MRKKIYHSVQRNEKQVKENELLREYTNSLRLQLVENEILEMKLAELEKEIDNLTLINSHLIENITKLENENALLKKESLTSKKDNLINFQPLNK